VSGRIDGTHHGERDNELLQKEDIALSVYDYEYGYFVYSGDGSISEVGFSRMEEAGFSKELLNLVRIAHEKGCKFLCLDCDGPTYNDLAQFDW
jgi:hypothetical protein